MKRQVTGRSIDGDVVDFAKEKRIRQTLDRLADKLRDDPETADRAMEYLTESGELVDGDPADNEQAQE
jgi:hypothetical protein